MYAHPGKKLLFMGSEIASYKEWNHDQALDWHLLEYDFHRGVQTLIRDMNVLYRCTPALYERDFVPEGFEWIDWNDRDASMLSWARRDAHGGFVICITNFTPVVRYDYRIGVPELRRYKEILNSDGAAYGGNNLGNGGNLHADEIPQHDRPYSVSLTVPPLATVWLQPGE
jgi:1,4-alpha-glucan branching enzyme